MKGGIAGTIGTILVVVIALWLFVIVLKVTAKLIGLAIILGLGAVIYFAVKKKIGGGDAR
jgi:hypothetical protein